MFMPTVFNMYWVNVGMLPMKEEDNFISLLHVITLDSSYN